MFFFAVCWRGGERRSGGGGKERNPFFCFAVCEKQEKKRKGGKEEKSKVEVGVEVLIYLIFFAADDDHGRIDVKHRREKTQTPRRSPCSSRSLSPRRLASMTRAADQGNGGKSLYDKPRQRTILFSSSDAANS